jgi:membrane protease YdiL (CAAX protease family)
MSLAILLISLAMVAFFVRNDAAEYREFKLLTRTEDRQRSFRRWTLKSLLLFSGTAAVGLGLLRQLRYLREFPQQFAPALDWVRSMVPVHQLSSGFLTGFLGAVLAGVVLGTLLNRNKKPKVLGDILPLLPRNAAETWHGTLISLNAGFSEEFFFRLFLPVLLVNLNAGLIVAFLLPAALFGLVHFYQGAVGIVATMILGLVLTAVYLASGNLLVAMCFHAGIDLMSLVARPTLMRLVARKDEAGQKIG